MLTRSTVFFESLPAKYCTKCGANLEELADCYISECDMCTETIFYPLSPVFLTLYHTLIWK